MAEFWVTTHGPGCECASRVPFLERLYDDQPGRHKAPRFPTVGVSTRRSLLKVSWQLKCPQRRGRWKKHHAPHSQSDQTGKCPVPNQSRLGTGRNHAEKRQSAA